LAPAAADATISVEDAAENKLVSIAGMFCFAYADNVLILPRSHLRAKSTHEISRRVRAR
jgi:hypothetical protein